MIHEAKRPRGTIDIKIKEIIGNSVLLETDPPHPQQHVCLFPGDTLRLHANPDWRTILRKYMEVVVGSEGPTFARNFELIAPFGMDDPFTPEELAAINELAKEVKP